MWRRVWRQGGGATLTWLAMTACAKTERSPDDESVAAAAGSANGGDGEGGKASGTAATAGKSASGGAPGSGGSSVSAGGTSSGGTGGSLGGGPSATDGGVSNAGGPPSCDGHYEACGCGCCAVQKVQVCVYPGVGSSLDEIIAADIARRSDTVGCAAAGCSVPQDYLCCVPPSAQDGGASYETSLYVGDLDHLRFNKAGAANCSTLALVSPNLAVQKFPLELPADWGLSQITRAPCSSSATGALAIGAIGKLIFRVSGNGCVVDAHLTAFFARTEGGVDAERFDAEGVPVNLSVAQCR